MPIAVRLDGGMHEASAVRRLAGKEGHLAYTIYADAARSLEWPSREPVGGTAAGGPLIFAVYGRIDAGEAIAAAGRYTDSITVTVDF
jgi:spore coat protein U-like protein